MEEAYSFKKASKEAAAMQVRLESGEARNYYEAEKLVDAEGFYQRFLPPQYIPSEAQVQKAKENGVELETLFYNASSGRAIRLGGELAEMIREELSKETKRARKQSKGEDAKIIYKENEAVHAVLSRVFESVPEEWVEHYQNGVLEIRLATLCKKPEDYVRSKEYFPGTEIPTEPPVVVVADMINFSEKIDWESLLGGDQTVIETTKVRKSTISYPGVVLDGRGSESTTTEGGVAPQELMNRLQKFRFKMGKAMQSGKKEDWDDVVDEYIELMDNMPQYIEHRLAVVDLLQRVNNGGIPRMPSRILSVASGPYEEARAQMDFEFLYKKYGKNKPEIFNLDLSFSMLKKAEEAYEKKAATDGKEDYWNIPTNIVADMRQLPIRDGAFDMVECSSFDNLIKRDPDGVAKTLNEMVRVLEVGGVLRISHKEQLPDDFFDTLRSLGLVLVTPPHSTYAVDGALLKKIESEEGHVVATRLRQKINRNAEYILAIKGELAVEAAVVVPVTTRDETPSVPRKEISLENANRLKESLNYFLEKEGQSKLFHENKRRRHNVPFKKFRRDILYAVVKSLIEEADNNLAVIHGVPYSMKDKLSEFMNREDESERPLVALDEVSLLDRPYREKLLRDYAPSIYQQLHKEGVVYEEGAP